MHHDTGALLLLGTTQEGKDIERDIGKRLCVEKFVLQ